MDEITIFNIVTECWAIAFCLMGILLLGIIGGKKEAIFGRTSRMIWASAAIAGLDLVNYLIMGRPGQTVHYGMIAINTLYYLLVYCLLFLIFHYYREEMNEEWQPAGRGFLVAEAIFALLCVLLVIGNLIFPGIIFSVSETNIYHRGGVFFVMSQMAGLGMALVTMIMVLKDKGKVLKNYRILMIIMIPIGSLLVCLQLFIPGTGLLEIAFCFYSVLQAICVVTEKNQEQIDREQRLIVQQMELMKKDAELDRQSRMLQKQEMELEYKKSQLLASQIRPHFIFNSLLVIRSLCMEDTDMAVEAINHFSKYLRIVLDTMNNENMVSFLKELELTKNYVYMEKLRFGENKIVFEKNFEITDFAIPVMTLQPIVENSIRHGIRGSERKGHISITTEDCKEEIVIRISDDGVGFDPSLRKDDGRVHVGLDNVRARIELICGGRLEVESVINEGTSVIMFLPKAKVTGAHFDSQW